MTSVTIGYDRFVGIWPLLPIDTYTLWRYNVGRIEIQGGDGMTTERRMKKLSSEYIGNHTRITRVEVDPEVYLAFVNTDWSGFTIATDTPNVVEVETLTTRDGSRWCDVLQDEILEATNDSTAHDNQ